MHIEFLIEDESGKILMEALIPKLLGEIGNPHTWKIHAFKGRGSVPKTVKPNTPVHRRTRHVRKLRHRRRQRPARRTPPPAGENRPRLNQRQPARSAKMIKKHHTKRFT